MAKAVRASVRGAGGSPTVEGRHRGYTIAYAPVWHPDAEGGYQSAGLVKVVTVTIRFDEGKDDPAAALGAIDKLLTGPVELRLPNFTLRGRVVAATFRQEADGMCRPTGATVEFRIEGARE